MDTILWRAIEWPGHEAARLFRREGRWHLAGTAVFADEGRPCRLDYEVVCDERWRSLSGRVAGWVGDEEIDIGITPDGSGGWRLNGAHVPEVAGSVDLDLNFSPSTNLLPIRRLDLAVGEEADVRAAWLRFPSFRLELLEQRYSRLDERTWRYESADGAFFRELSVNEAGFVTLYPGLWEEETGG